MKKNSGVANLNNKASPSNNFIATIVDLVLESFSKNDYFPSTR